jgi:hypothetical protein
MESMDDEIDGRGNSPSKEDKSNVIDEDMAQRQWDKVLYMIDFKDSDSAKDLNIKNCCESLHYDA